MFWKLFDDHLCDLECRLSPQGKRTNLRKVGSERIDHNMRVKFNPLALLLDSSLEGEFDLVQRIIYEVRNYLLFSLLNYCENCIHIFLYIHNKIPYDD